MIMEPNWLQTLKKHRKKQRKKNQKRVCYKVLQKMQIRTNQIIRRMIVIVRCNNSWGNYQVDLIHKNKMAVLLQMEECQISQTQQKCYSQWEWKMENKLMTIKFKTLKSFLKSVYSRYRKRLMKKIIKRTIKRRMKSQGRWETCSRILRKLQKNRSKRRSQLLNNRRTLLQKCLQTWHLVESLTMLK